MMNSTLAATNIHEQMRLLPNGTACRMPSQINSASRSPGITSTWIPVCSKIVLNQLRAIAGTAHGAGGRGAHFGHLVQLDFLLKSRPGYARPAHNASGAISPLLMPPSPSFTPTLVRSSTGGSALEPGGHFHNQQVKGVGAHVNKGQARRFGHCHGLREQRTYFSGRPSLRAKSAKSAQRQLALALVVQINLADFAGSLDGGEDIGNQVVQN